MLYMYMYICTFTGCLLFRLFGRAEAHKFAVCSHRTRCVALRRLAVCGKNDATCHTIPHRNSSGVNTPIGFHVCDQSDTCRNRKHRIQCERTLRAPATVRVRHWYRTGSPRVYILCWIPAVRKCIYYWTARLYTCNRC